MYTVLYQLVRTRPLLLKSLISRWELFFWLRLILVENRFQGGSVAKVDCYGRMLNSYVSTSVLLRFSRCCICDTI